jgi:hypothetical protein
MKTEIMPIYSNIMIRLYKENPYINNVTASGLRLGNGEFTNPDSGEDEQMDLKIICAEVIEVGPDCRYIKPGDDVYVNSPTIRPVPFMRQGFFLCSEQNVLAVMNNNLSERLKK